MPIHYLSYLKRLYLAQVRYDRFLLFFKKGGDYHVQIAVQIVLYKKINKHSMPSWHVERLSWWYAKKEAFKCITKGSATVNRISFGHDLQYGLKN